MENVVLCIVGMSRGTLILRDGSVCLSGRITEVRIECVARKRGLGSILVVMSSSDIEIVEDTDEGVRSEPILPGDPSLENVLFVLLGVVSMLAVILYLYLLFS